MRLSPRPDLAFPRADRDGPHSGRFEFAPALRRVGHWGAAENRARRRLRLPAQKFPLPPLNSL